MIASQIFRELRTLGATLERNGDRLTLRAGSRPIPHLLVEKAKRAKSSLLTLLDGEGVSTRTISVTPPKPSEDPLQGKSFGGLSTKPAENLGSTPPQLGVNSGGLSSAGELKGDQHEGETPQSVEINFTDSAKTATIRNNCGGVESRFSAAHTLRPPEKKFWRETSARFGGVSLTEAGTEPAVATTVDYGRAVYADFETLSRCDLRKSGTHIYARDATTEILILTYFAGGEFHEWAPAQGRCEKLTALAADASISFVSHGSFERLIWQAIMVEQFGFPPIPLGRWRDTTASSAYHRLPLELDRVVMALRLPIEKDKAGSQLVRRLSTRYRKTGIRPEITPEVFTRIAQYNRVDVQCLIAVDQRLGPLPEQERRAWQMDQTSNDEGFQNDLDLVHGILRLRAGALEKDREDFDRVVNAGINDPDRRISPTQRDRLLEWLREQGEDLDDLRKDTIKAALDIAEPDIRRVLQVRLEVAASSLKKLDAFVAGSDADGRARGTLVYHGAATGRWTGRRLQPQNLPRPPIKIKPEQIEDFVAEIKAGNVEALQKRIPPAYTLTDLLVSSLRHIVVARPGMMLAVGDFSMIEACIVLALAKQWDKCELIRSGKDPYRDMGAAIYALSPERREAFVAAPKEALTAEQEAWRAAGKVGVLTCGFAGSAKALHDKYPWIAIEDCERIVEIYREVWAPSVPKLWSDLKRTAHCAVRSPGREFTTACGVQYFFDRHATRPVLICRLLNGKEIFYPEPAIETDQFGQPAIFFSALKNRVWRRQVAWRGVLAENLVSGLARELLVAAISRLTVAGYRVVLSVHDELIVEGVDLTREVMEGIMSEPPQWALDAGIPIAVEGWVSTRYRK